MGQFPGKLLNLPPAGCACLIRFGVILRVGDGVQQFTAVLLHAQGRMERDHIPVALLRPILVDEPVADGPGGVGEEGTSAFLVGQNRLIESQHGNAQLVLVAVLWGGVNKFHCLRADEAHVLLDESVRCLCVRFCRLHLGRDVVLCPHHFHPSIPLRQKDTDASPDFRGHSRKFRQGIKSYGKI